MPGFNPGFNYLPQGPVSAPSSTEVLLTATNAFAVPTLVILTAIIAVAVGLLVFRWGWRKILRITY